MVSPLPGHGFRSDLRLLLLAAHAQNARAASGEAERVDPLRMVGVWVLMRSRGAQTAAELALLMGANERTARRVLRQIEGLLSVTDMSESVDRFRTDSSPIGAKSVRSRTDLSAHSLLSVDFDTENADAAFGGGQECRSRPPKRARASALGNLKKLGVSEKHRRELIGWATRKWPDIPEIQGGHVANIGGYLYTMLKNRAVECGYLDTVRGVAQHNAQRLRTGQQGRASGPKAHLAGPPCPHCSKPTETDVGRCGNPGCEYVTQIVVKP